MFMTKPSIKDTSKIDKLAEVMNKQKIDAVERYTYKVIIKNFFNILKQNKL